MINLLTGTALDEELPLGGLHREQSVRILEQDKPNPCISYVLQSSPKRLIVFILGGATYEESKLVHNFQEQVPGWFTKRLTLSLAESQLHPAVDIDVLLGGSYVHNFQSLKLELLQLRQEL